MARPVLLPHERQTFWSANSIRLIALGMFINGVVCGYATGTGLKSVAVFAAGVSLIMWAVVPRRVA